MSMKDQTAPPIRLTLLRRFELKVGHEPVPLIWSAQRLIALLTLKGGALGRAYVAEMLWPETTTIRANANLRSALWRTQRCCHRLIVASAQQLALAPDVEVDVRVALSRSHRLLGGATPHDEDLGTETREDLSADLLPEWYEDDWMVVERERYHQLRLHALEAMCERLVAAGRFGEAIDAGLAAVRAEPLRESAHEALVKAHLAEGNRWEAVRQYEQCRHLLREELGLEPSPALRGLLPGPSHERADAAGRFLRNRGSGIVVNLGDAAGH
jgi:DNA-binding SARP family transcriptional activator